MKYLALLLLAACAASDGRHTVILTDQYTSGRNRICIYNDRGYEYLVTLPYTQNCKHYLEVEYQ